MAASLEGHVNIVRMLIEAKTQVNTKDKVCSIPLQKLHSIIYIEHHTQCSKIRW